MSFLLVFVLGVWCVASFVMLKEKCVFLCDVCFVTAFLGGYVRGVSVCDCARVCSMYLCKDFHVYCEQFCAFDMCLLSWVDTCVGCLCVTVHVCAVCTCAKTFMCIVSSFVPLSMGFLSFVLCELSGSCRVVYFAFRFALLFVCCCAVWVVCVLTLSYYVLCCVCCVSCDFCFVTVWVLCTCALRSAFLGGYCVVLSVLYMLCHAVCNVFLSGLFCIVCDLMYLCKDFHVYCEQFCAFEYVLFLLVVVLCVWCALRTAFLGGYVRGVSVCDCARVCSMYLCKDFHVYCEQFCAFDMCFLSFVLCELSGSCGVVYFAFR
ncbi:Zinc Finger Mym-Type Protein 6 [Manis pentadactyla]|nr:Zinc Finger Mym-Type Protein 6 [Manis pentadactyla]